MTAVRLVAFALASLLCCAATTRAAAAKKPPKSTVCVPASYEIQYKVQQNRYMDRFANVILKKAQSDITRELRQQKIIVLCSPVGYRLLKGCFHVS
jgi:ABC-type sugar transport system substrate-binding protein